MPSFNEQTTIQEVAAAYPGAIEGHTYLITGATNRLGRGFAKFIAQKGAGTVVLTGRSQEKLANALEEVKSTASPNTTVKTLHLDQESEDSVRHAAEQITSGALGIPKIDVLVNNAGIFAVPYKKVHGYESQFFCNHLSHFLFTNLILSHMASPARVINVSSAGYIHGPVRFDDINFKDGEVYDKYQAYGQSKTANILFGMGLSKRFKSKGIQGFLFTLDFLIIPYDSIMTGIMLHLDMVAEGIKDPVNGTYWNTHPITHNQGTATYLYAVLAPELDTRGGAYLEGCQITDPLAPMSDVDVDRIWDLSNGVFGTSF
ncbi:hypothetical protein BDQ17DRAFT_1434080 [Cyathus striatus]|nr:hypothetical protein BDQ17DRAFT_1434080 [Cyathus striatus]